VDHSELEYAYEQMVDLELMYRRQTEDDSGATQAGMASPKGENATVSRATLRGMASVDVSAGPELDLEVSSPICRCLRHSRSIDPFLWLSKQYTIASNFLRDEL